LTRAIEKRETKISNSELAAHKSKEILSALKDVQDEIEKGNKRSVFKKIFGRD